MIDCLDRGKYYPATITNIREEEDQELRKIEYRIGFRVYPEYCPNWSWHDCRNRCENRQ